MMFTNDCKYKNFTQKAFVILMASSNVQSGRTLPYLQDRTAQVEAEYVSKIFKLGGGLKA
jgi:hypothetical protein